MSIMTNGVKRVWITLPNHALRAIDTLKGPEFGLSRADIIETVIAKYVREKGIAS